MASVREGLLGEVAFEQGLERLGRVWLRGSGGSSRTAGHLHSSLGACTSETAGSH